MKGIIENKEKVRAYYKVEELCIPEAEISAYRDPGKDWVPLPTNMDSYDGIEIYCSLVIDDGENSRGIIIFGTDPDSFPIDNLSDEADYLFYNA